MTQNTRNFTVADPRTFDGNPFEVADRAVAQTLALLALLRESVDSAGVMARNAEMERECQRGDDPDAIGWATSPQGTKFHQLLDDLGRIEARLRVLRRAAGFDPRNPPKA